MTSAGGPAGIVHQARDRAFVARLSGLSGSPRLPRMTAQPGVQAAGVGCAAQVSDRTAVSMSSATASGCET